MAVESKPIFHPEVIRQHLNGFILPTSLGAALPRLLHWAELISSGRADTMKETALLPDFLSDIFCNLLGYTGPAGPTETFTLSRETHVEVDGQKADAALGRFSARGNQFIVALEGKGTRDPLDRPFAGRKVSAVDQAYKYAINLQCDWIIVTSMRETRLYHKASNQQTFERFETARLATDAALLKRFVFLLGATRIVPETGDCHLFALLKDTESVGRELTNQFYALYSEIRQRVFARLRAENASIAAQEILRCSQKLLDRVLFCCFCEDRGLLPAESVKSAFTHSDPYNPKPIWENFRGLFRSVDAGNALLKIPAYNGGLFAFDSSLESLNVPDDVCAHFRDLADYDFRSAREVAESGETNAIRSLIDVDILGHIFEQSITDLERIRQEIEHGGGEVTETQAKSRRKKEGAFYTPSFITRYIVEQTLGSVLADRFEVLRTKEEASATGTASKALSDPNAYDLGELNEPQRKSLIKFWEAWQEELANVRILDPACGSGAFLIEAFDQLHAIYETSNARLEELRGQRTLFDLDRKILQNNLYGVDLNAEAIQICQLSLWIKTAAHGKKLTSLDHTIRKGNSVVSDPAVHPMAFDWQTAFPEVFAKGGFDVVAGNPPYIRQEWLAPFKPFWEKRYRTYHGVADIFVYFFEQGFELLRPGGQLAFITSGSWVRGNYGAPLRKFLASNTRMISMVDFGEFQPFEDAEMIRPSIAIVAKEAPGGEMRLFKWLTSGRPPETLSEEISAAPTVRSLRMQRDDWELEPDHVIALREKLSSKGKTLRKYAGNAINRGVTTGFNEAFIISAAQRDHLIAEDAKSAEIIYPFLQGTHIRAWNIEQSDAHIIFARRGVDIDRYPAILDHLAQRRRQLEPKPEDWKSGSWAGRKSGPYKWYEIQDATDYWGDFMKAKIVWPDITNRPRFAFDTSSSFVADTALIVPTDDPFLHAILSSWATWFFISRTAQPLRLRSDRWQYRLKAQYMAHVPIPDAPEPERTAIAELARICSSVGQERYQTQIKVQHRLLQAFGDHSGNHLNQKAEAWWELDLIPLGEALKQSFKLATNPMKNPRLADEWEPYLEEKRAEQVQLTSALNDAEGELNDRVYRLFDLSPAEIKLLQKEVEH